jgi:hypothetical protein
MVLEAGKSNLMGLHLVRAFKPYHNMAEEQVSNERQRGCILSQRITLSCDNDNGINPLRRASLTPLRSHLLLLWQWQLDFNVSF